MKKIFTLMLTMLFLLTSCDPGTYNFDASEITENALKIELVLCKNDNPVNLEVDENTVLFFDIDNIAVIDTLEQETIEPFANELSTITFHLLPYSVNAPVGYTLLIYMNNQEIIVISDSTINDVFYGMVAAFSNEGDYLRHIAAFADERGFKRLLKKYFYL